MSKTCKGCGVTLQNDDPKEIGFVPRLDSDYCQRCYKIRHYGEVTIDMANGIESNKTLDKINDLDGTVFWIADLFNLESNLISRLNQKLPGKKIVMVLTKRDVLPDTLSDEKIQEYVFKRLREEGIAVEDIIIAGGMLQNSDYTQDVLDEIKGAMDEYEEDGAVIFMGTANAGKSTLINKLTRSEDLTISRNPGTTLDVMEIDGGDYKIFDTPGIENPKSILTWLSPADLKTVIPTKPIKPFVSQVYEDQSFAVGGLARMDVVAKGKVSVVGYFSRNLPIHRGKLSNADALWEKHLGEMLSPAIDQTPETMQTYHAPKVKPGQKIDVVIHGLGWFCVSGDIQDIYVRVHKGIQVSFRKAMI